MTAFWVGLLVPVLILVGIVAIVVRRGFQMKQLIEDGIEVQAQVVDKQLQRNPSARGRKIFIRYRYRDRRGDEHEHRALVSWAEYEKATVGGAYPVLYSASQPRISAPKSLVEASRAALAKTQG